uniref:Uncharacterized protein n=1 Tax=Acrobeloides nanus TaxID=290746 RepID=A0A914CP56_9BILA
MDQLAAKYEEMDLSLNSKKSKFMLMTPGHKRPDISVKIGGEVIEQIEQFQYLGVELDPKLSYKNHVARMTTKCKQAIGALCRAIRQWAPRSTFGKLYQVTIEPIMCYSIESWYPSQVVLQNSMEWVKNLEAVTSSSLNTAKKLWNALPPEIVAIRHPALFKSAIRRQTIYEDLARNNKQRRIEEML